MARIGQGDKRYEGVASSIGVLTADRSGDEMRQRWQVWRWPAAVLAGVVLWLFLVAIAGAATPLNHANPSATMQMSAHACNS